MKDLPLSVLSRGCGQFVPCEGKQNGRLDVCFTPEDYYIWKARDPLLPLSTSDCVFTRPESTLPKTFSTRRGALLLYSQGLVTLTARPSNSYERNDYGECSAQPIQQGEISSIRSILNYSGENESNHGLPITSLPTLNHPHPADLKYFETVHCKEPTSEPHVGIQLPLSADRGFLVQQSQHEDGHKTRIDVFLQMPSVAANSWNNMEAFTSENPLRTSVEQTEVVEETDVTSGTQPSDSNSSNDHGKRYLDKASPKQSNTKQSDQAGVLLPPLNTGHLVKFESYRVHPDRVKGEFFKEQCADHLPSIEETLAGKTRSLSHKPLDVQPSKNTNGPLQPFLPRLMPEKYEVSQENAQKQRPQKTVNLHSKHKTRSCRITEGHASDNYNILLNPEEECTVPFGLLTGKRGPGHQSSLAFLQKLSDEYRAPDNAEVVRGVLPLELRDLNGQSVGSLILGPDGEIIQLSMFDNIQNCTQEQALQVVSAKGEKLPWVVMLQPEQHITNKNKETGLQKTDIQQGLSINMLPNPKKRSTDSGPGSVKAYSDLDAMDNSDLTDNKSAINTRIKSPKLDAFENIVPCLSTLDGTEPETKSREDTAVKDKKDLLSGQLSSLQQEDVIINKPNEMPATNISPNYAPEQNTVKDSKKLTKIKGTEESRISYKAKRKDARSTPNDQVASRKDREERKPLHDSQPDSGPDKNDNKPQSINTTKGVKGKEAKTRDIKKTNDKSVNKDTVDAEDAPIDRNKKKRRGKSKDKDNPSGKMTSDLLTDEITNSSQDTEEEVNKQGRIGLSVKQKHKNTKLDMIEDGADTDHFVIKEPGLKADKLSRSMRSLRSGTSGSGLKHSSSQKSLSSSCEGRTLQGTTAPLSLSHSRLSSCSTVMIPEERLMLNPTKSEVVVTEQSIINQDDYATVHEAEKMRIQREEEEEERKRRQAEEEQRRQQHKEELEQKMRSELQNERQRRAEESRLKKQAEDEEKQRREEEEQRRGQRQQEQREREMRRQQEKKRQIELFQRKREEEEQRKRAETERLKLLEEKRLQEENLKLQEMSVSERAEYQRKKQEEEDKLEMEEENERRREEETIFLAAQKAKIEEELLAREMALLHQRLSFKRGLVVESEGLEKSQGISRPWTYSYFTLLQSLGLSSIGERHT